VLPFAKEKKTTPWVAGGKLNRHRDSQRVSAEVEAIVMWGVGREDSATASGSPSQTVSVWQTWYKHWQPGSSDDGPGQQCGSEEVDMQAKRLIASPLRSTGRSRAEYQLRAQSKIERRGTKLGRIYEV
jgi:hypothetical protein